MGNESKEGPSIGSADNGSMGGPHSNAPAENSQTAEARILQVTRAETAENARAEKIKDGENSKIQTQKANGQTDAGGQTNRPPKVEAPIVTGVVNCGDVEALYTKLQHTAILAAKNHDVRKGLAEGKSAENATRHEHAGLEYVVQPASPDRQLNPDTVDSLNRLFQLTRSQNLIDQLYKTHQRLVHLEDALAFSAEGSGDGAEV